MGEKGSRKRKRTLNTEEESQEVNSLDQSSIEEELSSPKQKAAKKRKKENIVVEETNKKDTNSKEKKTKSKILKQIVEEEEIDEEHVLKDNDSDKVKTENVNKKGKKNKKEKLSQNDNSEELSTKNKKKKDKKLGSFGVVDKKLLKEAGGKVKGATEAETTSAPSSINKAVEYLNVWHKDRAAWKFNKRFQTLLIKAIYNSVIIDDDQFKILMLYLEDCKGGAKDKVLADAQALISVEDDHNAESIDPDMEKRARQVLQMMG